MEVRRDLNYLLNTLVLLFEIGKYSLLLHAASLGGLSIRM
jgi:hypothetical protein